METDWVGPGDSLAVEDKGEGRITHVLGLGDWVENGKEIVNLQRWEEDGVIHILKTFNTESTSIYLAPTLCQSLGWTGDPKMKKIQFLPSRYSVSGGDHPGNKLL